MQKKTKSMRITFFDKNNCETHRMGLTMNKPFEYDESTSETRNQARKKCIKFLDDNDLSLSTATGNVMISLGAKSDPLKFLVIKEK